MTQDFNILKKDNAKLLSQDNAKFVIPQKNDVSISIFQKLKTIVADNKPNKFSIQDNAQPINLANMQTTKSVIFDALNSFAATFNAVKENVETVSNKINLQQNINSLYADNTIAKTTAVQKAEDKVTEIDAQYSTAGQRGEKLNANIISVQTTIESLQKQTKNETTQLSQEQLQENADKFIKNLYGWQGHAIDRYDFLFKLGVSGVRYGVEATSVIKMASQISPDSQVLKEIENISDVKELAKQEIVQTASEDNKPKVGDIVFTGTNGVGNAGVVVGYDEQGRALVAESYCVDMNGQAAIVAYDINKKNERTVQSFISVNNGSGKVSEETQKALDEANQKLLALQDELVIAQNDAERLGNELIDAKQELSNAQQAKETIGQENKEKTDQLLLTIKNFITDTVDQTNDFANEHQDELNAIISKAIEGDREDIEEEKFYSDEEIIDSDLEDTEKDEELTEEDKIEILQQAREAAENAKKAERKASSEYYNAKNAYNRIYKKAQQETTQLSQEQLQENADKFIKNLYGWQGHAIDRYDFLFKLGVSGVRYGVEATSVIKMASQISPDSQVLKEIENISDVKELAKQEIVQTASEDNKPKVGDIVFTGTNGVGNAGVVVGYDEQGRALVAESYCVDMNGQAAIVAYDINKKNERTVQSFISVNNGSGKVSEETQKALDEAKANMEAARVEYEAKSAELETANAELIAVNTELENIIKIKNSAIQMEIPSDYDSTLDIYSTFDPMTAYCQSLSSGKYTDTTVVGYQNFVLEYTKNMLDHIKDGIENNTGEYLRLDDLVGGDTSIYSGVQGERDQTLIYNKDHILIADIANNKLIAYGNNGCISEIVQYFDYTPVYNTLGQIQLKIDNQPSVTIDEYIYDTDENGKILSVTGKKHINGNLIKETPDAITMNSDGILEGTSINMSDYWLHNQMLSFSLNKEGTEAIKNAISQDKNGDYLVSFYKPVLDKNGDLIYNSKGNIIYENSPTQYRVTQADIYNIKIKRNNRIQPHESGYTSGGYDSGKDIDATIIERAMELYLNDYCKEKYQLKANEDGTLELRDYNIGPLRAGSREQRYAGLRNLGNALFGNTLTTTDNKGRVVQIQNKSTQVLTGKGSDTNACKETSIKFLKETPLEVLNSYALQFNPIKSSTKEGGNIHPWAILEVTEENNERFIITENGKFSLSELASDKWETYGGCKSFYLEYFEFPKTFERRYIAFVANNQDNTF